MVVVPSGLVKKVKNVWVFIYSSIIAVLAYLWLYIVLKVWTENKITIPEAILTF